MSIRFTKMHGIGNDFVIIDARSQPVDWSAELAEQIADRHFGVGCDQLITIHAGTDGAAARYRILNQDGSVAGQCGNGLRCVAAWLWRDNPALPNPLLIDGDAGRMVCERLADGRIRAAIGEPMFAPAQIPFMADEPAAHYLLELADGSIDIGAVSMGNPHCLVVVPSVDQAPVATLGALLERHPRFPDRVNVGFAEVVSRAAIRLRVFERGVGETLACGSGASAAVAILRQRDVVDATVGVDLPGGHLDISWAGPGSTLLMSGPAQFVFDGIWNHD
ncbi:diaminopimelate epimerase [Ahniella affigens]|uniref:Diaminopimelate epimerase n=1 Tax=Ahniella affigens TaxID=2021234 RepID=A0A2P1PXT8_9GAMM|nr:diaminopimelate epimerase [Ahniella affigens]AVP99658.1 diaminopimelate epimerase [Ahniella affigens]